MARPRTIYNEISYLYLLALCLQFCVPIFCVYFVPPASAPSIWGPPPQPRDLGLTLGRDREEWGRRARGRSAGTGRARGRSAATGGGRSSRAARRERRSRGRPGRRRDKIRQPGGVGFLRRLEPGGGVKERVRSGDLGKFLPEPPQISANLPSSTGWCHHPVLEGL